MQDFLIIDAELMGTVGVANQTESVWQKREKHLT